MAHVFWCFLPRKNCVVHLCALFMENSTLLPSAVFSGLVLSCICHFMKTEVYLFAEDMPAGQTPHTVILYAHNDLVDCVQPGDRITVTGIYRAVPLRVNPRMRNVKSVYKTHIDVVHFRKLDTKRLKETDADNDER